MLVVKKVRDSQQWDDDQVFSAREMRVAVERAWGDGWNAALGEVDARREKRGGGDDDLRRLVGERFANALEGVWVASLRYLRSTLTGAGDGMHVRVGRDGFRRATGLTDRGLVMRGAGRSGGVVNSGGLVVDEAALAFKSEIDRKLRKVTREMERWLERRSSNREENGLRNVRKCVRCRRYGEEKWSFCPWDGAEMRGLQ